MLVKFCISNGEKILLSSIYIVYEIRKEIQTFSKQNVILVYFQRPIYSMYVGALRYSALIIRDVRKVFVKLHFRSNEKSL